MLGWVFHRYLIETDPGAAKFSAALSNLGFRVEVLDSVDKAKWLDGKRLWGSSGSISFIRELAKDRRFSEIGLLFFGSNLHNYTTYQAYVDQRLSLNSRRFLVPFSDLALAVAAPEKSNTLSLAKTMGWGKVFVRPNQALKVFESFVLDLDNPIETHEAILRVRNHSSANPETLCVVAPYQNILEEYRFVCDTRGVVSGSRYIQSGDVSIAGEIDVPLAAFDVAAEVAGNAEFRNLVMDELIVVDIAKTATGEYKFLEANCFSTSGMYDLDAVRIAFAVRREMELYQEALA